MTLEKDVNKHEKNTHKIQIRSIMSASHTVPMFLKINPFT